MEKYSVKQMILFILPLLLGTIGYLVGGRAFLDALFTSFCLYTMGVQEIPPNILVEIARWTAPLATATGVLFLAASMRARIQNFIRYHKGNSVAVYGKEQEKHQFLKLLGKRGINAGDKYVKADTYVFLDDEEKNIALYEEFKERLKGKKVYLLSSLRSQSAGHADLHLFSPEEVAARLYFQEHCLYPLAKENGFLLDIVMIGFGRLGQELLIHGLQENLFDPKQKIRYHIFGDHRAFASIYHEIDQMSDEVLFHEKSWYEDLSLIENASLVLISKTEMPCHFPEELLVSVPKQHFVFFSEISVRLIDDPRIHIFPVSALITPENVLGDRLYLRAKKINLRYASLYSGVEENDENMEKEWKKLDAFTRYSNISSSDYHVIQRVILKEEGYDSYQIASEEIQEKLSELEHMRWCRYHWLNNWKKGEPSNGKRKNSDLRIHADLISYQELSEAEKEKDRENLRVLFSIRE